MKFMVLARESFMAAVTRRARRPPGCQGPRCAHAPAAALLICLHLGGAASAVTRESPEVVAVVDKALEYLETNTDERLGGKCLIALAFHKRGLPETHPRIKEAVEACNKMLAEEERTIHVYSKGLAIIFLTELDAVKHRGLIERYAALLRTHQMKQGGFTYTGYGTGDTSQTQYAALAYWEMLNHGMSPDADSVQRCINWLMRTQDPEGLWGYQGVDPGSYSLVKQTDKPGLSMAAAGMGATLILGNTVGLLTPAQSAAAPSPEGLPPGLKRVEEEGPKRAPTLSAGSVSPQQLQACVTRGAAWFDKNFKAEVDEYQSYYLYSVERYKSFEEHLQGGAEDESQWYNAGFELLKRTQKPDGSWHDASESPCATAFSALFLMRSTQQSIKASLGEGTLVGGRGLPRDLSKLRLRGGKLVVQQQATEVDQLLDMLDDSKSGALDALLDDPAALRVTDVGPEQARRLQQIVRSGEAEARLMSVRALARLRDLDYAPSLIYALTDPDKRVVREARDGLRRVSRNFEGFGPSDNFEDEERNQAVERWKAWYRTVRPDAPPLP